MTISCALELARKAGFSQAGELDVESLQFLPQVRDMCETGRCGSYGKNWTCPPLCGSLEDIARRAKEYASGILVQSTGEMEDDFDVECMMDTQALHKKRFYRLADALRLRGEDFLPMSAGACRICDTCAAPEAPCRHPELAIPSMEAYGLVVSDVCTASHLPYYYGPRTITYTSCVLFHDTASQVGRDGP